MRKPKIPFCMHQADKMSGDCMWCVEALHSITQQNLSGRKVHLDFVCLWTAKELSVLGADSKKQLRGTSSVPDLLLTKASKQYEIYMKFVMKALVARDLRPKVILVHHDGYERCKEYIRKPYIYPRRMDVLHLSRTTHATSKACSLYRFFLKR